MGNLVQILTEQLNCQVLMNIRFPKVFLLPVMFRLFQVIFETITLFSYFRH